MSPRSFRHVGLIISLFSSVLLTACVAEDDGMFNEASTDYAACMIGSWDEVGTLQSDGFIPTETTRSYHINADHTFVIEDLLVGDYLSSWLISLYINTVYSDIFSGPPKLFGAYLSAGYWDEIDGEVAIMDELAYKVVSETTEELALNTAYDNLESSKPWSTSGEYFIENRGHCDEKYLLFGTKYYNYNLISDSPLTYESVIIRYQEDGGILFSQIKTLILNDDGTGEYLSEQVYPDMPSSDVFEEYETTYIYEGNEVTINRLCSGCNTDLDPIVFVDHGTVLAQDSRYLVRQ